MTINLIKKSTLNKNCYNALKLFKDKQGKTTENGNAS